MSQFSFIDCRKVHLHVRVNTGVNLFDVHFIFILKLFVALFRRKFFVLLSVIVISRIDVVSLK